MIYQLPTRSSWCFDVQWCPRDPSVFSAASFDGWITLSSVLGGSWDVQQMRQADQVCWARQLILMGGEGRARVQDGCSFALWPLFWETAFPSGMHRKLLPWF